MDVDIDLPGLAFHKQHEAGVPVSGEIIHISAAHRAMQQFVPHRTPVDEQELRLRVGTVEGWQSGKAMQGKTLALRQNRQGVLSKFLAQNLGKPFQQPGLAFRASRPVKASDAVAAKAKAHILMRHRQPFDDFSHGLRFRPVGFEEFQPRWRRGKQIPHLDPRAAIEGGGGDSAFDAAIHPDAIALRGAMAAGLHVQHGDRSNGGQSLTAKAKRGDVGQITIGQFRGGMALDRQGQIFPIHAKPVIHHPYQPSTAILYGDVNAPGLGVQRVFHQFLHGGSRALNHFARSDTVDENGVKAADGGGHMRGSSSG